MNDKPYSPPVAHPPGLRPAGSSVSSVAPAIGAPAEDPFANAERETQEAAAKRAAAEEERLRSLGGAEGEGADPDAPKGGGVSDTGGAPQA